MRRHAWWILGLVLLAGGIVVAVSAQAGSPDYGWYAYTPLSKDADWEMSWGDTDADRGAFIVTWWQVAGATVAVLGTVVLAAGAGYRLGRRPDRHAHRAPSAEVDSTR